MKDLEKYLPKEKGIVSQTVKEILQSLVDDRLVNAEKIGTSKYYWSFPSTALQTVHFITLAENNKVDPSVKQQLMV